MKFKVAHVMYLVFSPGLLAKDRPTKAGAVRKSVSVWNTPYSRCVLTTYRRLNHPIFYSDSMSSFGPLVLCSSALALGLAWKRITCTAISPYFTSTQHGSLWSLAQLFGVLDSAVFIFWWGLNIEESTYLQQIRVCWRIAGKHRFIVGIHSIYILKDNK